MCMYLVAATCILKKPLSTLPLNDTNTDNNSLTLHNHNYSNILV